MMAKGTYASMLLATKDLDATFEQVRRATPKSSRNPPSSRTAFATARPRPCGQPDPDTGTALSASVHVTCTASDRLPVSETAIGDTEHHHQDQANSDCRGNRVRHESHGRTSAPVG